MKMSGHEDLDCSSPYPSLMVTVRCETEDRRTVAESLSNSRTRRSKDNYRPSSFHAKNVYYNSHHRHQPQYQQEKQQQYFARPPSASSARRQQAHYYHSYDLIHHHYQDQTLRPLMEIKDNLVPLHPNSEIIYQPIPSREPKQRGQYRNRKAELDWDHAFDLDLIDLYKTNLDADNHSMTSTISSTDHSFSSI